MLTVVYVYVDMCIYASRESADDRASGEAMLNLKMLVYLYRLGLNSLGQVDWERYEITLPR